MDILYTFRRCPYAMRARLALALAGINVRLREVDLKHKPPQLLAESPKGTVPVLVRKNGDVLDESLDIVDWVCALPQGRCLVLADEHQADFHYLLQQFQDHCLPSIYRYKYPDRYDDVLVAEEQETILRYFSYMASYVSTAGYLFSNQLSRADITLLPFARQLYLVDKQWFLQHIPEPVQRWLLQYLGSNVCELIMKKNVIWSVNDKEPFLL